MDCFSFSSSASRPASLLERNLQRLLQLVQVFTLSHDGGRVTIVPCNITGQWRDTLVGNFERTLKEARSVQSFAPDTMDWTAVVKRLEKPTKSSSNTDVRLGFRYGNTYAVKHMFTFGQRTVAPGTVHVVQTTAVPLVYYELPSRMRARSTWIGDGALSAAQQHCYHRYVLHPHSKVAVPADTVYVLMALHKTVFAFDVLRGEAPEGCQKPTLHTRWDALPRGEAAAAVLERGNAADHHRHHHHTSPRKGSGRPLGCRRVRPAAATTTTTTHLDLEERLTTTATTTTAAAAAAAAAVPKPPQRPTAAVSILRRPSTTVALLPTPPSSSSSSSSIVILNPVVKSQVMEPSIVMYAPQQQLEESREMLQELPLDLTRTAAAAVPPPLPSRAEDEEVNYVMDLTMAAVDDPPVAAAAAAAAATSSDMGERPTNIVAPFDMSEGTDMDFEEDVSAMPEEEGWVDIVQFVENFAYDT